MPERLADPAFWVVVSVALYLGWAVANRYLADSVTRRLPPRYSGVAASLAGLLSSVVFFVGIPYLALVSGALDLRTLGLTGGDPMVWVPLAALIALVTWGVMATSLRRWAADGASPPLHPGQAGDVGDDAAGAFAGAVTQQCHLALYRGAIALAAGAYAGVFAGLALVILERIAGAAIRRRWPDHGTPEGETVFVATLTATSLVFLATGSLPASALAHFAIDVGMRWSARRRPAIASASGR